MNPLNIPKLSYILMAMIAIITNSCGDEESESQQTSSSTSIYSCNFAFSNNEKTCSVYDFAGVSQAETNIQTSESACESKDGSNGKWTKTQCSRSNLAGTCTIDDGGLTVKLFAYMTSGAEAIKSTCTAANGTYTAS